MTGKRAERRALIDRLFKGFSMPPPVRGWVNMECYACGKPYLVLAELPVLAYVCDSCRFEK